MGTSFVRYKDYGFWTRDEFLLDWLTAALRELNAADTPEWQIEIGKEWDDAVMTGFPGGINPRLDLILTGEDKIQFMSGLSKKIGDSTNDPKIKRLSELFMALIEGKLKSTVSSPIDYW